MEKKNFVENLYDSTSGVIVERRKCIITPILVLLVGVAILVLNYFIDNGDDANNLKSTLVLAGGLITGVGIVLSAISIFGGGAPYHTGDKCYLARKRYSFDRSKQKSILEAVENCDKVAIDAIDESDIAGVTVECYYSPCSKFCAMQAFTFEELNYRAITEVKVRS